jgi:hypothetical protein
MTKMHTLIAGLLVFSLCGLSSAQAGNDTSWIPSDESVNSPTLHAFAFTDRSALSFQHSVLQGGNGNDMVVCKSTSDSACTGSSFFKFNSILKVCSTPADQDCIVSVSSIDANGNSSPGIFSKYTVENHLNAFPADQKLSIPAGDMPSIWSIPGAPHASGSDYAIVAAVNGDAVVKDGNGGLANFMQISIIPTSLRDFGKGRQSIAQGWSQAAPGVFYDYCTTWQQTSTRLGADCNHVNGPACVLPTKEQGMCYGEEAFGASQRFNVQLRLSKEPTGWMHGRIIDPSISISKNLLGGVDLSVSAGATNVPMVYQNAAWDSLPSQVKNLWVDCFKDMRLCGEYGFYRGMPEPPKFDTLNTLAGQAQINVLQYINPFGEIPLNIMSAISPLINDKSNAQSSTWSVRTLSSLEMKGADYCITGTPGIKGIVTTNSVTYSAGPPEFKDGYLNYKVSSPHFTPDGTTPFKGNYSLVMRSDVARCLYGFTNAPISATISVVSSEGTNDVATSITGEKNGWISLSANNFQFSSPEIKVKFTQTPSKVKNSGSTPRTITCTKGKVVKKVTGAKPVCPKGYSRTA